MNRDLDGVYFRVKSESGGWDDVCFSDLTEEQMDEMLANRNEDWLKHLCKHLGFVIRALGDEFNIMSERSYNKAIEE